MTEGICVGVFILEGEVLVEAPTIILGEGSLSVFKDGENVRGATVPPRQ